MMKTFFAALTAVTVTAVTPLASPAAATSQAQVNATLSADTQIWSGLYALALGNEIQENCSSIDVRTFRATRFVYGLYSRARGYGFSRDEIRGFQRADSTETRLRAEVMAYFAENGVREGNEQSYCDLGRAEIFAGSQAGELLRAR